MSLRFFTAGESHGKGLMAILEGMVANLPLTEEMINREMARRKVGYGRGGRMKIEKDEVEIFTGVRLGKTLGSPIGLIIRNLDWENWKSVMQVEAGEPENKVTRLRPGHADFPGVMKYHQDDVRNILERSSARETAARTAVGVVCRALLAQFDIHIMSHVIRVGRVAAPSILQIQPKDWLKTYAAAEKSELRCLDSKAEAAMKAEIDKARDTGDSVGGVFEVIAINVPIGLGSHVHWDRKLDGRIAQAILSINAVKGVEFGLGFKYGEIFGSEAHDEIFYEKGKRLRTAGFYRDTNNAGGLEGGMTNGESLVVRGVLKPISTLKKPLRSVDLKTKEAMQAHFERADLCAVPSAGVIGEAMVGFVLAQAFLEKFGGDSLEETRANFESAQKLQQQL